jgi:hypothetical protein
VKTTSTEVIVKTPGVVIELTESEAKMFWDELTRMRQYSKLYNNEVPFTSDLIDALHDEIG